MGLRPGDKSIATVTGKRQCYSDGARGVGSNQNKYHKRAVTPPTTISIVHKCPLDTKYLGCLEKNTFGPLFLDCLSIRSYKYSNTDIE